MRQLATPVAGVIALWTFLATFSVAGAEPFRIADDPGTIVLEYAHVDRNNVNPDPLPLVRIYGDGVVWVHYPRHMPRAGDYELRLTRRELRRLIGEIERSGLLEFDHARTLARRAAMRADGDEHHRTAGHADTDTRIRIRLEGYKGRAGLDKSIAWTNVASDARAFPRLKSLRELNRLEKKLRAMIADHPLSPVELPLAQR